MPTALGQEQLGSLEITGAEDLINPHRNGETGRDQVGTGEPSPHDVQKLKQERLATAESTEKTKTYDVFAAPAPKVSEYLRPGARFKGKQTTDNQVHDVHVEIKYADFDTSFVCGYLSISKLTQSLPTLTTYFQGEIIGNRYGFSTRHSEWGASRDSDHLHWTRFRQRQVDMDPDSSETVEHPNHPQAPDKEGLVYMRWKEQFLVPDHRVREVQGASFSGFYYIRLDTSNGEILGYYYQRGQTLRERFQTIKLEHVDSRSHDTFAFC